MRQVLFCLCHQQQKGNTTSAFIIGQEVLEADIILEGLQQSEKMHGIQYCWLLEDGDSSIYHAVVSGGTALWNMHPESRVLQKRYVMRTQCAVASKGHDEPWGKVCMDQVRQHKYLTALAYNSLSVTLLPPP